VRVAVFPCSRSFHLVQRFSFLIYFASSMDGFGRRRAGLAGIDGLCRQGQVSGPAASGGSLVVGGLFAGSRSDKGLWRPAGAVWKKRARAGCADPFLDGMAPRKELLVPALAQLAEQGRSW
jgi:hypothetical protein